MNKPLYVLLILICLFLSPLVFIYLQDESPKERHLKFEHPGYDINYTLKNGDRIEQVKNFHFKEPGNLSEIEIIVFDQDCSNVKQYLPLILPESSFVTELSIGDPINAVEIFDQELAQIVQGFNSLKELNIYSAYFNVKKTSLISSKLKLESLNLQNCRGIIDLRQLHSPPLKYLSIKGMPEVKISNVDSLFNHKNLISISFQNTIFSKKAICQLNDLKKLKFLSLVNCKILDDDILCLKTNKTLEEIDLSQNLISQKIIVYISEMKNLKHAKLTDTLVKADQLKNTSRLNDINFELNENNDRYFDPFK